MGTQCIKSATGPALLALSLAACDGAGIDRIGKTADSMRIATEHMAADSAVRSAEREAQILEAARELEQGRGIEALPGGSRFEVRRGERGWVVYDLEIGRPARVGAKTWEGVTRAEAYGAAAELEAADAQNGRN